MQIRNYVLFLGLILFFIACENEKKNPLIIPNIFASHMVLQQASEAQFWGSFTPGKEVKVTGDWGSEILAEADETGNWNAELGTPAAGGPFQITIETTDSTIVLEDVMIGEVWLASGQSNMEMPLKGWPPSDLINNSEEEIADADYPAIRMFTVEKNFSSNELDNVNGNWAIANPKNAGEFSAAAYFFARKLYKELNIPIGIIHSSWGGTPAEAWTSAESLRNLVDFNEVLDVINDPNGQEKINNWFDPLEKKAIPRSTDDWNLLSFNDENKAEETMQDSDWELIALPGRFDILNNSDFNGAAWLRKEFEIKDLQNNAEYQLYIGAVDDMDITYINGQKIGGLMGLGNYNVPREFNIPNSFLKEGKNTIAIRAIDTGGPGWVNGPINITRSDGEKYSLEGDWKIQIVSEIYNSQFNVYGDKTDLANRPDITFLNQNTPSALYNAMLHPLVPYTIKGAIWYQGESNVGRAEQYQRLFPAMIEDWRNKWGYAFSFYFVQIAPYIYNADPALQISQELRDAQRLTLKTPKTGMAVTLDIGNPTNIHPGNKQDVGLRLANWALAQDYGKDLVPSGPLFKEAKQSGNKIVAYFDYTGAGLVAKEKVLRGFEIAGKAKNYRPALARIVGNTVEASSSAVREPIFVRYAWSDDCEANLLNKEGLPASSFSSEN